MAQLRSVVFLVFRTLFLLLSCHHVSSLLSPTPASPITHLLLEHNNATDRQALVSFKSAISSRPTESLAAWNDSVHFCWWPGITCSGRLHPQRVVSLNLRSFDLDGVISPAIANLTFLRKIDLSDNQIHGSIPQEIGRLSRLQHLSLSLNSLGGEYGVANKVSTHGDVYSYGILLLEMFTIRRPTDDMFEGGQSLRKSVELAFPERVMDATDPHLLSGEDGEESDNVWNISRARTIECVASVFRIGIICSNELPTERMDMGEVISELHKIRDVISRNEA